MTVSIATRRAVRRRLISSGALIAALSLAASGCGLARDDSGSKVGTKVIKIGLLAPVSGDLADVGDSMVNAAKLAIADINSSGELGKRKVELVVENDGCDAQTGTAAAQKLLDQGVLGLTGTYCSSVAIPVAQLNLQRNKLPFVTTAASNPDVTDNGGGVTYRMVTRDDEEAPMAISYLHNKAGINKIAILNDNSTYSKAAARYAKDYATSHGMKVVYFDAITPGQRDYSSALTAVQHSGAEALFYPGYYPELGLLASQWQSLGYKYALAGAGGALDPSLAKVAGSALDAKNFYILTLPTGDLIDTPATKAFAKEYADMYGKAPGAFSAYQYDAVKVFAEAVESIDGTITATNLNDAVHQVNAQMTTGSVSYDKTGDRVGLQYAAIQYRGKGQMYITATCANKDWSEC